MPSLLILKNLYVNRWTRFGRVFSTIFKKIYPDRICATLPYSIPARLVLANQAFQNLKVLLRTWSKQNTFYSANSIPSSGHMNCICASDWLAMLQTQVGTWFKSDCPQFWGLSQTLIRIIRRNAIPLVLCIMNGDMHSPVIDTWNLLLLVSTYVYSIGRHKK